jgi:hypothetical protein
MDRSVAYEDLLKRRLGVLRTLWFAMTMSLVTLLVAGYVVSMQGETPSYPSPLLRLGLDAAGIVLALAGIGLKAFAFSRERLAERLKLPVSIEAMAGDQASNGLSRASIDELRMLSDAELKVVGFLYGYSALYIVLLAINECVAVFGLILTLLTYQPTEMLPFLAAAVFLNARLYPHPRRTVEEAEALVRNLPPTAE